MFERVISLIGESNYNKIKDKKILLVGVGGVGGTALEALIRSGIEDITIVDYDIIDKSNLNRQLITNETNIGNLKALEAKNRCLSINSNLNIKTFDIKLNKENISIIEDNYDYIIDSCDSIDAKIELYKYAKCNNIKIISSMGMGNRLDPSKICISTLNKTINDPLARIIRKRCKEENIDLDIPVVYSTELPIKKDGVYSMIITPSIAGLYIAYYIINDIINL